MVTTIACIIFSGWRIFGPANKIKWFLFRTVMVRTAHHKILPGIGLFRLNPECSFFSESPFFIRSIKFKRPMKILNNKIAVKYVCMLGCYRKGHSWVFHIQFWGWCHKSWAQGANHRDSSLHPMPTPNFLRSFLLAQKFSARA